MTLSCRSHTVCCTLCPPHSALCTPFSIHRLYSVLVYWELRMTKMGNVKPHTHIQFIDFIFNAFFMLRLVRSLFVLLPVKYNINSLCSVCLCSMPLKALSTIISMAQDIFDFVCIAIQHLVAQAFTIQCGCIRCTVYSVVVLILIRVLLTVYTEWYVCWSIKNTIFSILHRCIHQKPCIFPIWSCFTIQITSKSWWFLFLPLIWHPFSFIFSFVGCSTNDVLMLILKRIQQTATERKMRETKWNGKICILNRCVAFYSSRILHKRMFCCPFFQMLLSIDDF